MVVTGASFGIGMEFAKRFSKEGHPVLMLARRQDVMEALNLPNCLCRGVDVTDLSAMQAAIKEAEELYGKTDLLINCTGLMLLGGPAEQDFEEWSRMIEVNVKGVLTSMKAVLADMMKRNEGTIINISSIAGRKTFAPPPLCLLRYEIRTSYDYGKYAKRSFRQQCSYDCDCSGRR